MVQISRRDKIVIIIIWRLSRGLTFFRTTSRNESWIGRDDITTHPGIYIIFIIWDCIYCHGTEMIGSKWPGLERVSSITINFLLSFPYFPSSQETGAFSKAAAFFVFQKLLEDVAHFRNVTINSSTFYQESLPLSILENSGWSLKKKKKGCIHEKMEPEQEKVREWQDGAG